MLDLFISITSIIVYLLLVSCNFIWYLKIVSNFIFYYCFSPVNWMIQLYILLFGLKYISDYIEANIKVFNTVFFIIVLLLSLQILFYVCSVIIEITKFIAQNSIFNSLTRKSQIFTLIYLLIIALLAPSLIFGMLYNLWIEHSQILTIQLVEMTKFDYFYFAFCIEHSLSITDKFTILEELIPNNKTLRIVQIIHILSVKTLELLLIGFIITKLLDLFNLNKSNGNSPYDIREFHKLRNQKLITNEQFVKIKEKIINNIIK